MKIRLKETAHYINKHKNIVDLGSAKGEYYRLVDLKKKHIVAVDIKDWFLRHIRLLYPSIITLCKDARETGLPDKSFDLVVVAQVLEHFEDYMPVIKEAKRLCKDDGYFYVGLPIESHGHGHFYPVWNQDDIIKISKKFGEIVELKKLGGRGTWSLYLKNVK
jgi:ubiquinone/menaquinone biosynthesis C-methylase UbiE